MDELIPEIYDHLGAQAEAYAQRFKDIDEQMETVLKCAFMQGALHVLGHLADYCLEEMKKQEEA